MIGYAKHVAVLYKAVYLGCIYVQQVHLHKDFYNWFIFLVLFLLSSLLSCFLQLLLWSLLYVLYPSLTLFCNCRGHPVVFKYMNAVLYVQSDTTYDVIIFIY